MSSKQVSKQTGVEDIPKEWKMRRLGEISRIVNGFGFPIRFQGKKKARYVFVKVSDTNIDGNEKYITETNNTIDDTDIPKLSVKIYPKGTILFPKIGMVINQNKKRILAVEGTFDNNLMGVIPKGDVVDGEFLYYYFLSRFDLRKIANRTTMPSIRKSTVEKQKICLPPLAEQRGIARILICVDEAIQKTNEIIAKAEKLKRGLMQRLFTRGVRHTRFKQTELGEIPETWEIARLEELSEGGIENGVFKKEEFFGHGSPLINVLDLFSGMTVDFSKLCRVELTESELEKFHVKSGDVLFCRSSLNVEGVGHCCLVPKEPPETTVFECHVMRAHPKKAKVLPKYLVGYCLSPKARRFILSHSKTTTMTTINQSDLGKLPIALPPLHEQKKISSMLFSVDDKIRIEQRTKAELGCLKNGLMRILLMGKVRVKVD